MMKARLSLLYFLQFSVWGCYLTSFGQLLGAGGLGKDIAWFYAAIGLVSIITPPIFGRLADRTGRPERLLSICHFLAAALMLGMWRYGISHSTLDFHAFFPLYLTFLAFYMPTMALANTSAFGILKEKGYDTVTLFPKIRIWGTVGFVAAMWFVNSAYWNGDYLGFTFSDSDQSGHLRFQYNAMQLLCSGIMGLVTCIYAFFLPSFDSRTRMTDRANTGLTLQQSIRRMFSERRITVFLIFVIFSGVCLQISNGFATPFISHFSGLADYAGSIASGNATMLFSLSQISEACCFLIVGIFLRKKGIRLLFAAGLFAWSMRFLLFAVGNPGDGLWALIGSMLVYGIAFDFVTIGSHIYIQQVAPSGMKGFAQGLVMFMSNGIGATAGTLLAGEIVNRWCHWETINVHGSETTMRLFMGDWNMPWFIFSGYAIGIMVLWFLFFRIPRKQADL